MVAWGSHYQGQASSAVRTPDARKYVRYFGATSNMRTYTWMPASRPHRQIIVAPSIFLYVQELNDVHIGTSLSLATEISRVRCSPVHLHEKVGVILILGSDVGRRRSDWRLASNEDRIETLGLLTLMT